MKKNIILTGKETKAQLVQLLKQSYAYSVRPAMGFIPRTNNTKWDLLRFVKLYNLSEDGDVGSVSTNKQAQRNKKIVCDRLEEVTSKLHKITINKKLAWNKKWSEFQVKRYNLFDDQDILEAMKFLEIMEVELLAEKW